MGVTDRIEQTVKLAHPPIDVWAALTTVEALGSWFGVKAEIDLRPGGAGRMWWTEDLIWDLLVERVEKPRMFGFTWRIFGLPEEDPRRTYVEFTLEPVATGTRLTVGESGFAQLPMDSHKKALDGHDEGWVRALNSLVGYLSR
ncbi:SRPBCC domain-containing protein [Nocardia brasiliensis]|uniref:SRPBCC domain-containing protein n=1 Tax=Nocardia brasiliensis TaxID=37326 RepID=UPI00366E4EA2